MGLGVDRFSCGSILLEKSKDNGKGQFGGPSTAQRTMELSAASVGMTGFASMSGFMSASVGEIEFFAA